MKRKLLTALIIAALAVMPAMTAFAAPENPSVEAWGISLLSAFDADGNVIEAPQVVRIREILESQKPGVSEVEKPENLKTLLGDKYSDDLQVLEEVDVYIYDVPDKTEVEWDSKECEIKFPITLSFSVPGVTADTELYVLHGHDTLTMEEWHVMDIDSIEDGKVTLTFTHLSPLVFLTENAAEGGDTPGTPEKPEGPASPGTGESNVVVYATLVVIAAATVAVATRKKMA
ncbi:MAG: hypothetical protein IKJ16_03225 [Agathobacter sp.]|nr:hypothetical protein [Agathobacter sp.]